MSELDTNREVDLFDILDEGVIGKDDSKKTDKKTAPKKQRRDIKGLNETCAVLEEGDYVTADFTSKRYGSFRVTGTTVNMIDGKSLVVGSWVLSTDGKPSKYLQGLVIEAEKGSHDHAIVPGSTESEDHGSN